MKLDHQLAQPATLEPHTRRGRQRGASLLEGIAYLGIAAIVVMGAVALLRTAFGSANSNTVLEQLTSMQTAARKLFLTTQGNYGVADFTQSMIDAGAVPQGMATTSTAISNVWGGTVLLSGAAGGLFTISYAAVPADVCVNVVSETTTSCTQVVVGANAGLTPPITPSQAATACGTTSSTIVWTSN